MSTISILNLLKSLEFVIEFKLDFIDDFLSLDLISSEEPTLILSLGSSIIDLPFITL
jgi:hypothetical protein